MGSPDEFFSRKRHRFLLTFIAVVFPLEAHLTSVDIQQAMVRNRDVVSIPADVIEHLLRASKGPLGIDDPFRFSHGRQITGKLAVIAEILEGGEES